MHVIVKAADSKHAGQRHATTQPPRAPTLAVITAACDVRADASSASADKTPKCTCVVC